MSAALSTIHAPELTRWGWAEVHCYPEGGTRRRAPDDCPLPASHKTWNWTYSSDYRTPPGYGTTRICHPALCDHEWRERDRPTDLLELLAVMS